MEPSSERDKWEDHSNTTLELEVELGKFSKNCFNNFRVFQNRWIELLFNPRNKFEQTISDFMRFFHPYLAFITYRFHVEKAREIGKYCLMVVMTVLPSNLILLVNLFFILILYRN